MLRNRVPSLLATRLLALLAANVLAVAVAFPQTTRNPATLKEFLSQYKGKEVLIIDKTGGQEQFTSGEQRKAYLLILRDVQNDYIVVSRNVETDKRTFVYPISIIRRIIYQYDNKPYDQIVLELY